LGIIA